MKKALVLFLVFFLLTACSPVDKISQIDKISNIIEPSRTPQIACLMQNEYTDYLSVKARFYEESYSVSVYCAQEDQWGTFAQLKGSINDCSFVKEVGCYGIIDAYLVDTDPNTEAVELLIVTDQGSSDPCMHAYQYENSNLTPLYFSDSTHFEDYLGVGSAYGKTELNEDGSLTITTLSPSYAMWGIKEIYRLSGNTLTKDIQDYYEVDMESFCQNIELDPYRGGTEKDEEMMKQGYFRCRTSYSILSQGDYFTLLYDDGNNNIYIKSESGTEGWIPLPEDYALREAINPYLLYLAG